MSAQQEYMKKLYGDGVLDGMEITLKLLLGIQPKEGGDPFGGRLPDDAEVWAEKAWAKIALARRGV